MKYRYREPHEMKDSGVEWLGMIPKEWKVSKLKYLAKILNGKDQKEVIDINGIYPILGSGGIFGKSTEYIYDKPSVLLGRKGTIDKPRYIETPFWVVDTSFYTKISKKFSIKLFYYLCTTIKFDLYSSITAIPSMTQSDLNEVPFAISNTKYVQQKIADFLDNKCEEFDSVIAKKEMLINKLEEAKKSLISEVVTGKVKVIEKENGEYGIIKREAHEMKDSGVEWLGMIPKEWEAIPFKYILNERSEKNTPIKTSERLSLSIDKGVTLYSEKTTNLDRYKEDVSMYKLAYEGDLVLNSMNMIVGAVGISKYFGCVSPAYYTYYDKTKDFYIARYCELILKSERTKKELFSLGKGIMVIDRGEGKFNTIRLKVSREDLNSLKLPMPRLEELKQSTKLIEKKCSQFDLAIRKEKEIIEKLKSAKQSLISEAVTGKIEVL